MRAKIAGAALAAAMAFGLSAGVERAEAFSLTLTGYEDLSGFGPTGPIEGTDATYITFDTDNPSSDGFYISRGTYVDDPYYPYFDYSGFSSLPKPTLRIAIQAGGFTFTMSGPVSYFGSAKTGTGYETISSFVSYDASANYAYDPDFGLSGPSGVSVSGTLVNVVPLPASASLFGAALLGLGALGYGMKRRQVAVSAS